MNPQLVDDLPLHVEEEDRPHAEGSAVLEKLTPSGPVLEAWSEVTGFHFGDVFSEASSEAEVGPHRELPGPSVDPKGVVGDGLSLEDHETLPLGQANRVVFPVIGAT